LREGSSLKAETAEPARGSGGTPRVEPGRPQAGAPGRIEGELSPGRNWRTYSLAAALTSAGRNGWEHTKNPTADGRFFDVGNEGALTRHPP